MSWWRKKLKKSWSPGNFVRPTLRGGPDENSGRPCILIHSPPCRTPCRLFIHKLFIGPLGLHLLVWSEVGQSPPFRPMRALTLPWPRAFSLVCEVALTWIRWNYSIHTYYRGLLFRVTCCYNFIPIQSKLHSITFVVTKVQVILWSSIVLTHMWKIRELLWHVTLCNNTKCNIALLELTISYMKHG